jgi:hypothetical protein
VGGVWVLLLLLHVMLAMWAHLYFAIYIVWGAFAINMNNMLSSLLPISRVSALWSRLQLRQMAVVLRTNKPSATLLNCLGFGKLPLPSFNTKNHKKKMVHSSPRSYPYADHDLVMPFFMAKAGLQGVLYPHVGGH